MCFELISQRNLSREQCEVIQEATSLLGKGYDRRELLRLLGLAGTSFVGSLLTIRPANAFVPAAIIGLEIVGGFVARGALILATFTIANANAKPMSGLVGVRHIEPSGNIAGSASTPVTIPANSEKSFRHSGFRAKVLGDNDYQVQSARNEMEETFEVVEA